MKLKLILEARCIPNEAIVTKPTGTMEYTLLREFRFYSENIENRRNIEAKDGCIFLLDKRGCINVYGPTKLLAWTIDNNTLHDYLHELENNRDYGKI